jgi:hypothetical protein
MRRLFWLGAGLAVGALVVRKLTKKADAFTPAAIGGSLQASAAGVLDSLREFVEDVREGMAERESELYAALAGDDPSVDVTDPEWSESHAAESWNDGGPADYPSDRP